MKSSALAIIATIGLATAFGAGWTGTATAAESISKVTGSIHVEAGTTVDSLDTVNGSIDVGAKARSGDASTVNGSIKLGDAAQVGALSTVNGSIRGGRDVLADSAATVNGQIYFDRGSRIRGNISTVNGSIGLVGTRVDGEIEMNNGDLTVGANSHVIGGIHYDKPGTQWFSFGKKAPLVVIGPAAQVDGALVFERDVRLLVHDSARVGPVTGATAETYSGNTPPR